MMRKWAFFILASATLCAAPVENGAAPKMIQKGFWISCSSWIDFRCGYEGDFITDGRMEQYDEGSGRVDQYKQWTNSASFTLNFLNRLDLYGIFGSSKTEADWRFQLAETVNRVQLETEPHFLWAVGSRAILYEWFNTSLGFGGRYTSCDSQPASLISNGIQQPVEGARFDFRQWQANLDLSYKISLFTPYIGTKYSHARTDLTSFLGDDKFKNRTSMGLYLGCTISNGCYFMLNIEGRLFDEEAVTVSGDFRF